METPSSFNYSKGKRCAKDEGKKRNWLVYNILISLDYFLLTWRMKKGESALMDNIYPIISNRWVQLQRIFAP
jgi:hypothetical protein